MARTNNRLESLFHTIKHGERRRSGRKILTQDFEILPPAAALATNLHHADYVSLVCGSLDRLPEAFAALDAHASVSFDRCRCEGKQHHGGNRFVEHDR